MSADFVSLAERIIDELLAADPALASAAGDHRQDDRLPDLSAEAWRPASRCCATRRARCPVWTPTTWTPAEQVDHEQLLSLVERALFELTEIREHEWNPLVHNPGSAAARAGRPPVRAGRAAAGVAGRPAGRDPGRAGRPPGPCWRDCPRIHLETAVGQFRGYGGARARRGARRCWPQAPALSSTVEPVAVEPWPRWRRSPTGCASGPARRDGARPPPGPAAVGGRAVAHPGHRADRGRGAAPGPGEPRPGQARRSARPRPSWSAAGRRRHGTGGAEPARRRPSGQRRPSSTWPGGTLAETTDFVRDHDWCPLWTIRA